MTTVRTTVCRSSRRRPRRRNPQYLNYTEEVTFLLAPGNEVAFTKGQISLKDRDFTPVRIVCEIVSDGPAVVALKAYQNTAEAAAGGPWCVGTTPRFISLRYPPGFDPITHTEPITYKIAGLQAIKFNASDTNRIRGIMRVHCRASAENFSSATLVALEPVPMID